VRVLVACEFSGVVRRAFAAVGHEVYSADFEDSMDNSPNHYKGDCFDLIDTQHFDLMIAHPPCTYLCSSGLHWNKRGKLVDGVPRSQMTLRALSFVRRLLDAPIEKIALENPIGAISTGIRKPDQIVQPWMFGHGETKATCLWLKGLPKLEPTDVVEGRHQKCWLLPPSPDRWKLRSITYEGIATAMANQWGTQ